MHRVVREPWRPGVLPMVPVAITAALAILMAAPSHAVQTPAALPSAEMAAAQAPWPWMAVALLSALTGALLALWLERRHQRVKAELRETRDQAQRLAELSEHWQWQTDLGHRLVSLQTPSGASALPATPSRPALWEHLPTQGGAELRTLLDGHGPLHDIVVTLPAGPGSTPGGPALLRGGPRHDERGARTGHAGTLKPIAATPAAPMAQAMVAPNDAPDAEQASFSYTVSHDLRAPIRVVEGFTRILKEDYGRLLDRIGNDHLDRVLGAAARMNSMIDSLLALSRLSSQPLSRQPVNLSQLAAYVAEDLRRQVPGREVLLHIEPGLQVQGDPTLLRLVIENLLGNAWKYTGKTSAPEVWFERVGSAEHTYTVRDNGAGFDMRFCDRLFGVFQRLHSASDFQGTGVGLASVRRIVRRHGGEVWAEAEVDRGASFYFSLPQLG